MTEFLGFEMLDGEFKVMGMAPVLVIPGPIMIYCV